MMKAMILAAGKGTRLLPVTEKIPKSLIQLHGITILEHTINYLKYFGIRDIIINVHHHAEQIIKLIKYKKSFDINIVISDESDMLMDTGGGLKKAAWFFNDNEPFLLTTSDVVTDLDINQLIEYHLNNKALVTLPVKERQSTRNLLFDKEMNLCGWKSLVTGETNMVKAKGPAVYEYAFSTIHVINPGIFNKFIENDAFSIMDSYLRLAGNNIIKGFVHNHSKWFEMGRIENLQKLQNNQDVKNIMSHFK